MTEKFWAVLVIVAGFVISVVAVTGIAGLVLAIIFAGEIFLTFIEITFTIMSQVTMGLMGIIAQSASLYFGIQVQVSWRSIVDSLQKLVSKLNRRRYSRNAKNSDTFRRARSSKKK